MSGLTEEQAGRIEVIRDRVRLWGRTVFESDFRDLLSIIDSLTAAVEAREGECLSLKRPVCADCGYVENWDEDGCCSTCGRDVVFSIEQGAQALKDALDGVESRDAEIVRLKGIARGLYGALDLALTTLEHLERVAPSASSPRSSRKEHREKPGRDRASHP